MAFLDSIITTTLDGTQTPSAYATNVKALADATKNTVDVEHDQATGQHKFAHGVNGAQPASPLLGQLYINTQKGFIEYYNGSAWKPVNFVYAEKRTSADHSTSTLQKEFYMNGSALGAVQNYSYAGKGTVICSTIWQPAGATDTLTLYASTDGTTLSTSLAVIHSGNTASQLFTIVYSGSIALTANFFILVASAGTLSATAADHQLDLLLIGN